VKNILKIFLLACFPALLFGCGGNNYVMTDDALTKPYEWVSVPHPLQMQKEGAKNLFIFYTIEDPGFMVEAGPVNPAIALLKDGKILSGWKYVITVNRYGRWIAKWDFYTSREVLEGARFLAFNKDTGYAIAPNVGQIYATKEEDLAYNPEKFKNDWKYKTNFIKLYGNTLEEIDEHWVKELKKMIPGYDPNSSVFKNCLEYKIGTKEWDKYAMNYEKIAKMHRYKMPNGEWRLGFPTLKEFKKLAFVEPGFDFSGRFYKNLRVPIPLMAFIPGAQVGYLAMMAGNLANTALGAGMDTSWKAPVGRGITERQTFAPYFRFICELYQELLLERDKFIFAQGLAMEEIYSKLPESEKAKITEKIQKIFSDNLKSEEKESEK